MATPRIDHVVIAVSDYERSNRFYAEVLGVDVTANFRQGTVTGLIKTDVCIGPGDSGRMSRSS